jgi:serine/threonine-protein kinase HipA
MTRRAPVYRWITSPSGQSRQPALVGQLTQQDGRWEFVFDADYLDRGPQAWELDPADIRVKQRGPFIRRGVAPAPVFCDLALSGWSLDVLHKHRRALTGSDEAWGWWERLVYAPADGFGALFVGEPDDKPRSEVMLAEALGMVSKESLQQARLDSSSGAMGGERPKISAHFHDPATDVQVPVILKFPLPGERGDTVVAEATALTLARELGMSVPVHAVVPINGLPALRIARFDRSADGKVWHCVSAATALRLTPPNDPDDPLRSYVQLRSMLRHPGDALELFRRIVLNAAVGNTDDHPWNTSLRQMGLSDWRLSPLYDVLPYFHREGTPVFRMAIRRNHVRLASTANLIGAGLELAGLGREEALALIDATYRHVRQRWRAVCEGHAAGLPQVSADDWKAVFEPPM